ncbi:MULTISPECIES: hypothetical protein [unclassified Brachybacterium]|uniref:hypothetical protein n=1 Tax=unclassified Brachybacterium TaxID=2623841 RepID=UPI004033F11C
MRSELSRRTMLGAGGLVALLGTAGCSNLPQVPFGAEDSGLETLLQRIGGSGITGTSLHPTAVLWARPAAVAEVLGLDGSVDTHVPGPVRWLQALEVTDPQIVTDAILGRTMVTDPDSLASAERLMTPTETIRVNRDGHEGVLWAGAAGMLEDLAEALGEYVVRDGDRLRVAEGFEPATSIYTRIAAPLGEDLAFSTDETLDGFDAEESVADLFPDRGELIAAMDLEDPHLVTGASYTDLSEASDAPGPTAFVFGTRFDSAEAYTTRGAVRVHGDAKVVATRMLDEASSKGDEMTGLLRVVAAKAEGDLVRVEISSGSPEDDLFWDAPKHFHQHPPPGMQQRLD